MRIIEKKISWISWDVICRPKEHVGLGIKNLVMFNTALLAKWKWNLFHHVGFLWGKVLESKCRGCQGLDEAGGNTHKSIWWRNLRMWR